MIAGASRRPSPWYDGPFDAAARFNQPLPDPSRNAPTTSFADAAELETVRLLCDLVHVHAPAAPASGCT